MLELMEHLFYSYKGAPTVQAILDNCTYAHLKASAGFPLSTVPLIFSIHLKRYNLVNYNFKVVVDRLDLERLLLS